MKRIELETAQPHGKPWLWKATSSRFGVSAYGRCVKEARQRLFVTVNVEKSNRGAFYDGLIISVVREWESGFDNRPG